MSALVLELQAPRARLGLKGPRAAEWLAAHGIDLPAEPNSWTQAPENLAPAAPLVARLGAAEFFMEDPIGGTSVKRIAPTLHGRAPGVYPVLREDWAFQLAGDRVHDVLEQVCNINFAALRLDAHPLVMTLMIGVAVLVVPQGNSCEKGQAGGRRYRIWCDPTFGPYMGESLGSVVNDCGGRYMGVPG
jgi:sarcosine oxidase subunit gamma